jgi:sodium-dependent dicarboxylate transporter 2/3/5
MCLGELMIHTGLARALGETLAGYVPSGDSPLLVVIFCLVAIAVSEATSNTAAANMVIPVVMAVTAQVGGDAVMLGLAATAACTFGFMLPVSTLSRDNRSLWQNEPIRQREAQCRDPFEF